MVKLDPDVRPPGFRLVKSETVDLTLALAKKFHKMETTLTERDLNERHVQHLQDKAVRGRLITFHWTVGVLDGQEIRVNGMHSSTMLCRLNGAFPQGLKAHIDTFQCDDGYALAELHRQIDDKKSTRTMGDLSTISQRCSGAPKEENTLYGKFAVRGVAWYFQRVEQVRRARKGDDILEYHFEDEVKPFRAWVAALFSDKNKELHPAQIVAAMYATYTKNPIAAQEFWDLVSRQGIRFEEDAAVTRLSNFLTTNLKEKEKPKKTHKEQYNGCIDAWNAYRAGKRLNEIKYSIQKGFYPVAE